MPPEVPRNGHPHGGDVSSTAKAKYKQSSFYEILVDRPFNFGFSQPTSATNPSPENIPPPSPRLRDNLEEDAKMPRLRTPRPGAAQLAKPKKPRAPTTRAELLVLDSIREQRAAEKAAEEKKKRAEREAEKKRKRAEEEKERKRAEEEAEKQRKLVEEEVEEILSERWTLEKLQQQAAQAPHDKNGRPIEPDLDDPDYDGKCVFYYAALAEYFRKRFPKEIEEGLKAEAEEEAQRKKDGKKGGSLTRRRGVKINRVKTGRELEEDGLESMTENYVVQHYARSHEDRNWDECVVRTVPAFEPLPQATRDQDVIKRTLAKWDRMNHQAKVLLPDSSGFERRNSEEVARRVKPNVKKLEADVKKHGGYIATGPSGSKVRLTMTGQRVGSMLMARDEKAKAAEGK